MITSIRIPSRWFDHVLQRERFALAEFKLGLGPCGKEVVKLGIDAAEHGISINQVTKDRESKVFVYLCSQITGRIEITES